jgi:hypothetical protein
VTTAFTRRAIIVIPAARLGQANNLAAQVDTGGHGDKTFRGLGLSATGVAPATHYWCSWQLTQADWTSLSAKFPDGSLGIRYFDADLFNSEQVLTTLGLQRILPP